MSLSSFCVVTNALRLNLLNIRSTKKDKKKKNAIDVSLININNNEKKEVNEDKDNEYQRNDVRTL